MSAKGVNMLKDQKGEPAPIEPSLKKALMIVDEYATEVTIAVRCESN